MNGTPFPKDIIVNSLNYYLDFYSCSYISRLYKVEM